MSGKIFRWFFWMFFFVGPMIFFSIVLAFGSLAGPWFGVLGAVIFAFFIPLVALVLFKLERIAFNILTIYSVINFIWIALLPIQAFIYITLYDSLGYHVDPATGYILFYILTTIPMALIGVTVWLIYLNCVVKNKENKMIV